MICSLKVYKNITKATLKEQTEYKYNQHSRAEVLQQTQLDNHPNRQSEHTTLPPQTTEKK